MDDSVGQVVEALHEKRMLNKSIVVFLSDNGAPSVEVFQNWGSNYPLRGVSVVLVVLPSGKQVDGFDAPCFYSGQRLLRGGLPVQAAIVIWLYYSSTLTYRPVCPLNSRF